MGISLGLVGLGQFGSVFAPLFKSHPLVDRIALCDREPELVRKFADDPFYADKFNRRDAYASLDDICRADLDALVIITQPWLHAPQCIQAMKAGKHVYSAVPIISVPDDDEILDWCGKLVEACTRTGMKYMLGETTYYRPNAMFCRRKAKAGAFGDFVYAEGEYFHDLDAGCSLRVVFDKRTSSKSGQEWLKLREKYVKRGRLTGPMHYPTHSTAGPVCVMGAHGVAVNCHGHRNRNHDPFFADHAFSDEVALFTMSNGATVRICEFRECAGAIAAEETFRIMGTRGTYAENRWQENFRTKPLTAMPLQTKKLTDAEMRDPLPPEVQEAFKRAMHRDASAKDLQNLDFVPEGHGGSHPYLVHEFVDAVAHNRQPAINIWEAARYMAMGVAAHQSALKDGETVKVADWGDAPGERGTRSSERGRRKKE